MNDSFTRGLFSFEHAEECFPTYIYIHSALFLRYKLIAVHVSHVHVVSAHTSYLLL